MKYMAVLDGVNSLLIAMPHQREWLIELNIEPFTILKNKRNESEFLSSEEVMRAACEKLGGNEPVNYIYSDEMTKLLFEGRGNNIDNLVVNLDESYFTENNDCYEFTRNSEQAGASVIHISFSVFVNSNLLVDLGIVISGDNSFRVSFFDNEMNIISSKRFTYNEKELHNFTLPMLAYMTFSERELKKHLHLHELIQMGKKQQDKILAAFSM